MKSQGDSPFTTLCLLVALLAMLVNGVDQSVDFVPVIQKAIAEPNFLDRLFIAEELPQPKEYSAIPNPHYIGFRAFLVMLSSTDKSLGGYNDEMAGAIAFAKVQARLRQDPNADFVTTPLKDPFVRAILVDQVADYYARRYGCTKEQTSQLIAEGCDLVIYDLFWYVNIPGLLPLQ